MENTLKELLAVAKSINEKLERIENSRKGKGHQYFINKFLR